MANKIYPFDNPNNYDFDPDKIEIVDGKARLKKSSDFDGLVGYWKFEDDCQDSSGQGNHGTNHGATFVDGKVGRALSFDGVDDYVDCGNVLNFDSTDSFSISFWWKSSSNANMILLSKAINGGTYRGWYVYFFSGNRVGFRFIHDLTSLIKINAEQQYYDNKWHFYTVVYNGNSKASGFKIYVDGVEKSLYVEEDSLSGDTTNNVNLQISGRDGLNYLFNGIIDEVCIYNKVLSAQEIQYHYNSGLGRHLNKYPTDKPTIKPKQSWEVVGISQFVAFVETLGAENQGNIAYQLSDDDGANWRYWNGSTWAVTTDQYNDAATVNDNIDKFPVSNEKILFRAFLISDGEKQCELDAIEINAQIGYPPVVYAGADKECYDHQTIKPFSDATISDPDGDIEQATALYDIEGNGWIQIPKGGYGTLQEAIRNFQYTFDNLGIVNCKLKVIDQQGKSTIDDVNVTVKKYKVTFNVRDKDGYHLANIQFSPGDGSDWQTVSSPFTWEYEWKDGEYIAIFDKVGFQTVRTNVEPTVHTENITMQVLGAISPQEVADAVWDELANEHTDPDTFGGKNQNESAELIKRILGLTKENFKLYDTYYSNGQLIRAKIRIYPSATDLENDTNPIATYQIEVSYNPDGTCKEYKEKKL